MLGFRRRLGSLEDGEYAEKTTCWEEEADKKKIMDLKCSAFSMVKKSTGDQTANKAIMQKGGSESAQSYVNRVSATVCGNVNWLFLRSCSPNRFICRSSHGLGKGALIAVVLR